MAILQELLKKNLDMNRIVAFFSKHRDYIFLFLLSLTPLLWWVGAEKFSMIVGHDAGYPLNPVELFISRLYAWHNGLNFGVSQKEWSGTLFYHGIEALVTAVTGSVFLGQKLYVVLWFALPMFAMYWSIRTLRGLGEIPYVALGSAILYGFNHFQIQGWGVFWRTRFAIYASLPIFFVLLVDYFEGRRSLFRTAVGIGLLMLIFNGGGSPPIFGPHIVVFAVVAIGVIIQSLKKKSLQGIGMVLRLMFASGIATAVASSFWLLPYMYYTFVSYSSIMSAIGGMGSILAWADVVSTNASILNLLRLQGFPFWNPQALPDYPVAFITQPILIALSFVWPICFVSAFYFLRKPYEKRYIFLLLGILLLGGILSAGTHAPFKFFYSLLIKYIPGYVIFRSPFYKFGTLLWFTYAIVCSYTIGSLVQSVQDKVKNKTFGRALFSVYVGFVLFWSYPIFTSKQFDWNPPLSTFTAIPSYIFDYGKWADLQKDEGRSLLLPEFNETWHADVYTWNYWSLGTLPSFLTRDNTTVNNGLTAAEDAHIVRIYKKMKQNDPSWVPHAKFLGIDSLVLRNDYFSDLWWGKSASPSAYTSALEDGNVQNDHTFGAWSVFTIKDYESKSVYLTNSYVLYDSEDTNVADFLTLFPDDLIQERKLSFISYEQTSYRKPNIPLLVTMKQKDMVLPVKPGQLILPQPRVLPGSFLYFWVSAKENDIFRKAKNSEDIFNAHLGLSLKRLGEVNELIRLGRFYDAGSAVGPYLTKLTSIHEYLLSLHLDSSLQERTLLRVIPFMKEQQSYIADLTNSSKDQYLTNMLELAYTRITTIVNEFVDQGADMDVLEQLQAEPGAILLTSDYSFSLPEERSYDIYVRTKGTILPYSSIQIDSHVFSYMPQVSQEWTKLGTAHLQSGEHTFIAYARGKQIKTINKKDIVFFAKPNDWDATYENISYKRIDPTLLQIHIPQKMNGTLVFDERYDPQWILYPVSTNSTSKVYWFVRRLWLFFTAKNNQHVQVNGISNAWTNELSEGTYILEYWPQRLFYVGFVVSIVTGGLFVFFLKKHQSKKV